jgi:hypothetical protein
MCLPTPKKQVTFLFILEAIVVLVLIGMLLLKPAITRAQIKNSPYLKKYFILLASTKNYTQAKATAAVAAKKLGTKLNLRGLLPHKKNGLTFLKNMCTNNNFNYPCYVARGREDDAKFISIEWSNAFKSFTKGYYVVVATCGNKKDMLKALRPIKKIYTQAYIKQEEVYVGCLH